MKKGTAISVISILAVAVIALGALFGVTTTRKNEIAARNTQLAEDIAGKDAEISTLIGEVDEKAEQIETLTAEAAAKAEEVRTLTEDASGKDEQIEALTAETAAKDEEIKTLTEDASGKDEQIEALKTDAAQKQAAIEEKDAKIGELEATVAGQETAMAEKDQQIGELQGKVDTLTAEIAEKDEQIRTLNAQLDAKGQTTEKQPEETVTPAGDRMTYTEGAITFTMPEDIKFEMEAKAEGQKLFGNIRNANTASTVFLLMNIDLGVDFSTLGDSMMPIVISAVQKEIEKMDGISDAKFEEAEILGRKAINAGFTFNINGKSAPAYGTILFMDQNAYILFYASLDKTAEQVKAEMTECIASIRMAGSEAAPSAGLIDDRGLKFGMTREELTALLGAWDETEDFNLGYSIVRYQNTPFHGYSGTFGIIFRDDRLHMWMYGIQNSKLFGEMEPELTEKYGAPGTSPESVIEVFKALDVTINEAQLNGAMAEGSIDYRFWHVDGQTDCVLMLIKSSSGREMTVFAYMQPVK